MSDPIEPRYLGDGVYASSDGMYIWLHVNDHRNLPVVALELEVFQSLERYAKKVWPQAEEPQP